MTRPGFIPWTAYREYPPGEMLRRAESWCREMQGRRSVREFSERPVEREVLEACIRTAGSAPSGANLQPWKFVVVQDAERKRRIREGAEEEERRFYRELAPREWLDALAPLGTDEHKRFLETAPALIVIFSERYGLLPGPQEGDPPRRVKHYYAVESVGLATGFLIAALHHAGLATLTHTPSPMNFLNEILDRGENERPFLILVAGYPAPDVEVPDIHRKPLEEISVWL